MTRKEKTKLDGSGKMNPKEELQEKYIELQMLKQQIAAYVEQKQALDERENELNMTIDALKKIPGIGRGNEMWSSIGSGAFVRSDIKDIEKVLVAVGAGVVAKETMPRAIEILESRLAELRSVSQQIVEQANALVERISELEPQMERLAGQVRE